MKSFITKKPWDFWMFVFALILITMGIIMVFSASTPFAQYRFNNIYHFLSIQLVAALIGFILMIIISFIDYRIYKKVALPIMGVSFLLLILVLVPGIGVLYNDARRWIQIGPLEFQPSEIYKLGIIIFMAAFISKYPQHKGKFFKGYLPYLALLGISALLMLEQPHLSGTIIILMVGLVLLYAGGAKIWHFILTGITAAGILTYVAMYTNYMSVRITSYLDPFAYASDDGYQVVQSLYAIGSGGFLGRGLGRSVQKFLYLPEPQNDFIFAIAAEELGFFGVVVIIGLFSLLVFRGIKTAIQCDDEFGSLLAMGISALIFIQTALNIGVVTGSIPPTGIALPFFSSGGTSLIIFMMALGILLNISRHSKKKKEKTQ